MKFKADYVQQDSVESGLQLIFINVLQKLS
jgi:hypothetical protein